MLPKPKNPPPPVTYIPLWLRNADHYYHDALNTVQRNLDGPLSESEREFWKDLQRKIRSGAKVTRSILNKLTEVGAR